MFKGCYFPPTLSQVTIQADLEKKIIKLINDFREENGDKGPISGRLTSKKLLVRTKSSHGHVASVLELVGVFYLPLSVRAGSVHGFAEVQLQERAHRGGDEE